MTIKVALNFIPDSFSREALNFLDELVSLVLVPATESWVF
jgi:hypothetical protein